MTIYFESHVTIEPVFDHRLSQFASVCTRHGFRVAELLMKKREQDTPVRSKNDSFCTGRSNDVDELRERTIALVDELEAEGFQVWRYKLEDTIIDSRYDDSIRPLVKDE